MQYKKSYYNIKMTKKEYLINILNQLVEKRPIANTLIILISNNEVDSTTITKIINILKNELKNTTNKKDKQMLDNTINYLERIKEKEALVRQQDEEDLEELEDMLGIK